MGRIWYDSYSAKREVAVAYRSFVARLLSVFVVLVTSTASWGVDVEGVQPAALDQPRVNIVIRRDAKGKPLTVVGGGGAAADLAKLLGAGGAGGGDADTANIQAFLDTGASGVLLSATTSKALGLKHATSGNKPIAFHDVGVGGSEAFAVSEPLFVSMGVFGGAGEVGNDGYPATFGPVRMQLGTSGGGLIEQLTGGLDVVGMPAMKGRVVVLDPRPVDSLGATMLAHVLDPRLDRSRIPKVDRTVVLSRASFKRFTRTEPAGAEGPTMGDNPFVGPNPVAAQDKSAKPQADVPRIVATMNGKTTQGSWLLDTGAAASMISVEQAKALGITYAEGTEGTDAAKLVGVPEDQQFTFTIGGIGGQKKSAGFFLDTLTLPTREHDPVVYKKAPVLVSDITVVDPATNEQLTLDGVLGMNYFVASANIKQSGLMPDISQITAGPYEAVVFDEPASTLGLKLKADFNKPSRGAGAGGAGKGGSIQIKPSKGKRAK